MGPRRTASGSRRPSDLQDRHLLEQLALDGRILGDPADDQPGNPATGRRPLLEQLLHEGRRVLAQVAAIGAPEHEIGEGRGGCVHRRRLYGEARRGHARRAPHHVEYDRRPRPRSSVDRARPS